MCVGSSLVFWLLYSTVCRAFPGSYVCATLWPVKNCFDKLMTRDSKDAFRYYVHEVSAHVEASTEISGWVCSVENDAWPTVQLMVDGKNIASTASPGRMVEVHVETDNDVEEECAPPRALRPSARSLAARAFLASYARNVCAPWQVQGVQAGVFHIQALGAAGGDRKEPSDACQTARTAGVAEAQEDLLGASSVWRIVRRL
jgi:hypothetical protein